MVAGPRIHEPADAPVWEHLFVCRFPRNAPVAIAPPPDRLEASSPITRMTPETIRTHRMPETIRTDRQAVLCGSCADPSIACFFLLFFLHTHSNIAAGTHLDEVSFHLNNENLPLSPLCSLNRLLHKMPLRVGLLEVDLVGDSPRVHSLEWTLN